MTDPDPSLPEYIGSIEEPADGHVFGEDLTCVRRKSNGYRLLFRWGRLGQWQLAEDITCIKRRDKGPECGRSLFDHLEEPGPCKAGEGPAKEGIDGDQRWRRRVEHALEPIIELKLTRTSKWSRIQAAKITMRILRGTWDTTSTPGPTSAKTVAG